MERRGALWLALLVLHVATVAGDIRCFCNMPQCIATSYMCKASAEGGCFSDLKNFLDPYTARHGCVDLLPKEQQSECRPAWSPQPTLLLCCQKDMCNHIDSPGTRALLNATYLGATGGSNASPGRVYFASDVWLKAATIAVPICGGFILVVLIVLAIKILRKDSKRQHQPPSSPLRGGYVPCQRGPIHINQHSKTRLLDEGSPAQAPQIYNKNMAHAKLNYTGGTAPIDNKQNNMFINVNNAEQVPVSKHIITWGKCDSASPV